MTIRSLILLIVFSVAGRASAELLSPPVPPAPPQILELTPAQLPSEEPVEAVPVPKEETFHAWAPIVGYNPTYKFFFGGGYFYHAKPFDWGSRAVITMDKVYQVMLDLTHRFSPDWNYHWEGEYSHGFDPYYGEGGDTKVEDLVNIYGYKILSRFYLNRVHNANLTYGLMLDFRLRRETDVNGDRSVKLFPDTQSLGVGVSQQLDHRDNGDKPTKGFLQQASFIVVPKALNSNSNENTFSQADFDFCFYQQLVGDFIVASRFRGGFTFGTPSYLYKFRLGGTKLLRGYLENRMRGRHYYLHQDELRFPLWKIFSGAAYVGFGDTTDTSFTKTKLAYGVGIRIGLPPDFLKVARIDIGWGKDERGIFLDFGQSF